jgi:hypothetical protein
MGRDYTIGMQSPPSLTSVILLVIPLLLIPQLNCWCYDSTLTQFGSASEIDFSFDNVTFLATDPSNKLVNFWRIDTKELLYTYVAPSTTNSAKFSKDGSVIGIGMQNGDVILLNANTYTLNNTLSNPVGAVVEIDFSWLTNSLIVCSSNSIKYISYTGSVVWTINPGSSLTSCKLNKADGVGYANWRTITWNPFNSSAAAATDTKSGGGNNYVDVDFSMETGATAMRLIGGNQNGNIYYVVNTNTASSTMSAVSVNNNPSVCYSKDNNFIGVVDSSGGGGGKLNILNATGRADYIFSVFSDSTGLGHCRFNYNTKYLAASASSSGSIYIYTINCFPNKCQEGYYDNSGVCTTCSTIAACQACASSAICTSCVSGFYLNSNSCSSCNVLTGCRSCESNAKCT